MINVVYYNGPFKNEFGFADPAKMAPLDMQSRRVLELVAMHSRCVDWRKEAKRLMDKESTYADS